MTRRMCIALGLLGLTLSPAFAQTPADTTPGTPATGSLLSPCLPCEPGTDGVSAWRSCVASPIDGELVTRSHLVWAQADYLLWHIKGAPKSGPLLTTGPPTEGGAVGEANTRELIDGRAGFGVLSGLRLSAGVFIDPDDGIALEGGYFALQRRIRTATFASDANGNPQLARPFLNETTGNQTSLGVSFPDTFSGDLSVTNTLRLQGWEAMLTGPVMAAGPLTVRWQAGYRALDLREGLSIFENVRPILAGVLNVGATPVDPPGSLFTGDNFSTANHFNGGCVGGRVNWAGDWLAVDAGARVSMGVTRQRVGIDGFSGSLTDPSASPVVVPGGVLAQSTNIGSSARNAFSVVPELSLGVSYSPTQWLLLRVGYQYLYWTGVARPGDQIDHQVADTSIPTSQFFGPTGAETRPARQTATSDFYAHGLTAGVEIRY